jgi:hypothetical protein
MRLCLGWLTKAALSIGDSVRAGGGDPPGQKIRTMEVKFRLPSSGVVRYIAFALSVVRGPGGA